MPESLELVCEVCRAEKAIGVFAMPYIPMSVAYGPRCVDANAHPLWAVTANTALCGGRERCREDWIDSVVVPTIAYHGITMEEFDRMVGDAIAFEMEREREMEAEARARGQEL